MPVRKFRTVDEMSEPVWREPGDPTLYATIAGLWDLGLRVHGRRFVPGVSRFRSIDDLEAATDSPRSPPTTRRA
jgi:hypothetical protein